MRKYLLVAALAALAACKDQAPPPPPTVDGAWIGTSGSMTMNLTLAQTGSAVAGSGQISGPDGAIALNVSSGTFVAPSLSLTLSASGFEPMNYTGVLSMSTGAQISGMLNGSGFQNEVVNLTKQ